MNKKWKNKNSAIAASFLIFVLTIIYVSCNRRTATKAELERYKAQKELQYLALSIADYRSKNGKIHLDCYAAAKEWGNVPTKWREHEIATDPWGGEYKIVQKSDGLFVLSKGPNGIDQNGSGDDLVRIVY